MSQNAVRPTPASPTPPGGHLLEVRDLHVEFRTSEGVARVINGVSYHLDPGETLAVLGESGSGKSVTAQAVMGILDTPPAHISSGAILYSGQDLLTLPEAQRRQVRGKEIAMIFQDALSALNPVFPVGWQIGETLRQRLGMSRADARRRSVELMDLVQIPAAAKRLGDHPHQFSGGMRQRVMIAMALAMEPKVLIADEPTTALDVTVQAQIMDLLADLRRDLDMAMILITHDLGVVADVADRIAVMYAGRIVEHADVRSLYRAPAHPYTKGLLNSIPRLDQRGGKLATIRGLPPNLMRIPSGCPFHPRCPYAQQVCVDVVPHDLVLGDGRTSACHFAQEVRDDRAS
ncbi:peptide/nickel transport system ATP-binding protein [Micromonospora phaseoli]|uniref:Peptide/nickel transport system ATP-binding protein n=1 Tax=Micromonospora phaseoli TaxID=1144548 RepID=A0A1H6WVW7_9ACTN|nr:ABC transporter ATP-binding protein [Micromonospora phaseoli]PZW01970.1 peptide/nickel transport system ATP-binding protein [Micromonospora phaseoli]GIJ81178.1 ABC transporter ATP-binding protein [Micromonospora phaseoli]SEJ20993.1 peptide/nickel transport system ATP-binding protein [Micromonospora phaseoli]